MRIALLGTGTMGAPMARHLARAGHDVRVWNRTRTKAEGVGATIADSPAAAVAGVEVAITMLADGPTVYAVMRDALPSLTAGAVWVQMSTVGAEWADKLTALATKHDVDIVDAPVMGSLPQAEDGKLVPLASGPERACTLIAPVLAVFSRDVLWLGDEPGAGSRLKLVVNHWILNSVENLAQTIAFADALELDPRRFLELISGAPFDMKYAHWKGALMLEGEFPVAFALKLARKDMQLALEAAMAAGVELAMAEATERRMARGMELGYGEDDNAVTYLVARENSARRAT